MNAHHIKKQYMQNIVLDINCLIMAVSANGEYYKVWQDFLNGKYNLCVCNDKHFSVLKDIPFPHVDVVNIDEFLETLK